VLQVPPSVRSELKGIIPIFLFCGALELAIMKGNGELVRPLVTSMWHVQVGRYSEEESVKECYIELNNGRLRWNPRTHGSRDAPFTNPTLDQHFLGFESHFNEGWIVIAYLLNNIYLSIYLTYLSIYLVLVYKIVKYVGSFNLCTFLLLP
jgi:hypothetical protein